MRNPFENRNYMFLNARGGRKIRHHRTGGRLVLHKRKPLRNPAVAQQMAMIRARGVMAPGNIKRASHA